MRKNLKLIGSGRHREVYRLSDRNVIKIPIGEDGIGSNYSEARTYRACRSDPDGIQYARCRLLQDGSLVMEYVEEVEDHEKPEWSSYIDCGQVGRNRTGKIVAYDYGL